MADVILADGDASHNQGCSDSSHSCDMQLSKHLFGLTEDFVRGLSQARVMLAVAKNGLLHCDPNTQQQFFNLIDHQIEGAILSFVEMTETYRDWDEKK